MGQFADWKQPALAEAPCFRRSVEVLFYMKWPERVTPLDRGDLKMIYATRYCSMGLTGYVYLPGPGDWNYRFNALRPRRHEDGLRPPLLRRRRRWTRLRTPGRS